MLAGSSGQLCVRNVTTATTGRTASSRYFRITSGVRNCSQVPPTEPSSEKTAAGAKSFQSTYPCRNKATRGKYCSYRRGKLVCAQGIVGGEPRKGNQIGRNRDNAASTSDCIHKGSQKYTHTDHQYYPQGKPIHSIAVNGKKTPDTQDHLPTYLLTNPLLFRDFGENRENPLPFYNVIFSSSAIHSALQASLGIRQSPRGDSVTDPTFGPSGKQLLLNCWAKKRR